MTDSTQEITYEPKRHLIALFLALLISLGTLILYTYLEKKQTTKEIYEMVENGDLTKEQGDAILWLMYDYKPNKHKK